MASRDAKGSRFPKVDARTVVEGGDHAIRPLDGESPCGGDIAVAIEHGTIQECRRGLGLANELH